MDPMPGYYYIVNKDNGNVLDNYKDDIKEGNQVIGYKRHTRINQQVSYTATTCNEKKLNRYRFRLS